MIEVGKVKVNENIKKNVFLLCIIFSFCMFLMFSINLASLYIETKDYVEIQAVVTDVGVGYYHSSDGQSTYYYADLEYNYNGEHYSYKQRLHMFIFYPKINSKVNIYINPNLPTEVRDTWIVPIDIGGILFSLIFNILTIKAYLIRRRIDNGN